MHKLRKELDGFVRARNTPLLLLIFPVIFMLIRLALIPVVWPAKPPTECISEPYDGCGFIFDEAHYIPAVRRMMAGEWGVNLEHPPLSKLLIMAGILLLGDNPWGWRSLNVLFSSLTILVVGILAYRFSKSLPLAMVSQFLLLTDITLFNISGLAILDPPALCLLMLSLLLYSMNKRVAAGIALGAAMLAKSSSLIAVLALMCIELSYPIINGEGLTSIFNRLRTAIFEIVVPATATLIIGLGLWNGVTGVYPSPLHHLSFMLNYHSSLVYWDPDMVELPLSWVIPPVSRPPAPLYVETVLPGGWHPVGFWAVSSPLWWAIWLLIPLGYSRIFSARPVKNPNPEAITLGWTLLTFGVFLLSAHLYKRWVYTFYFTQISPVMAFDLPLLLGDKDRRPILVGLLVFQLLWFIIWFPVKSEAVLTLLKHLGLGEVPFA